MITIHFRDVHDALHMHRLLKRYDEAQMLDINIKHNPEALLKIKLYEGNEDHLVKIVIPAFATFIVTVVEGRWMKEMIQSLFYFTDLEEQEQILSMARGILDGEKEEIPNIPHRKDALCRKHMIETAFLGFLTTSVSFSFESFLQFRLKTYRQRLYQYVALAIDEYQLEQEYQTFVENLRQYVATHPPLIETVYILHDRTFHFFDQSLQVISKPELNKMIDQQVLKESQMDLDLIVIAPLISMAPKQIKLMTNDPDSSMIRTIQNIFEERVQVLPKQYFKELIVPSFKT